MTSSDERVLGGQWGCRGEVTGRACLGQRGRNVLRDLVVLSETREVNLIKAGVTAQVTI